VDSDAPSINARSGIQVGGAIAVDDRTAADLLRIGRSTWRRLVASGDAPQGFKVGHARRWLVAELNAWASAGAPPAHAWKWRPQ
jgi:predicted DNA-binding transcriptional regulator AlpA